MIDDRWKRERETERKKFAILCSVMINIITSIIDEEFFIYLSFFCVSACSIALILNANHELRKNTVRNEKFCDVSQTC